MRRRDPHLLPLSISGVPSHELSMQPPNPRKLDFWLWAAVIVIVAGATTLLLTVRWEPAVWKKPAITYELNGQPKSAATGLF